MAASVPPVPIPPLPEDDPWLAAAKIFLGLAVIAVLAWRLHKSKNRRRP